MGMEGSNEGEVSLNGMKDRNSTPGKTDGRAESSHEPQGRNCFIELKLHWRVFQAKRSSLKLEESKQGELL